MFRKYLRSIYIYIHAYLGNIFIGGAIVLCSFFIKRVSFYNKLISAWGKWNSLAMPGKISVNGLENIVPGQSYIVIANHESTVDVFFILGKIPIPMRIVAKEELRNKFIIGAAMKSSGFIFVDNKIKGRSINHLNESFELLKKEGISLMVFPEGSRFKDTLLAPFRMGAFVMAINNKFPILPVVMKGPREMMPPESKLFNRVDIELDILLPIDTSKYTYDDRHALMDRCYHLMHGHLEKMHS